jgi:signal transduction histidine kinase
MVLRNKLLACFAIGLFFGSKTLIAQQESFIYDGTHDGYAGLHAYYFQESLVNTPEQALSNQFTPFQNDVQSLSVNPGVVWVRIDIVNRSSDAIGIKLDLASYDRVDWYLIDNGVFIDSAFTGELRVDPSKEEYIENNIFNLQKLRSGFRNTVLIRLVNTEQIVIPLRIDRISSLQGTNSNRRFIFGVYTGIMLVMFLYNIFLAFSIRERIYLHYLGHLLFAWLTQAAFQGIAAYYFWPGNAYLTIIGFTVATCMVSVFGILFMRGFLQTSTHMPGHDKVLQVLVVFYLVSVVLAFSGIAKETFALVLPVQALVSVFILYVTVRLVVKGSKQARFYLIGWALLFVGITIYVLKDFGVLPFNDVTNYALMAGTALEVVLLSIALADRINILEEEKRSLISRQKDDLQREVAIRTAELRSTNSSLEKAYNDIKEAQSQLINAEKMASLGQLTAGIAHEINNPINFINANVKPLKRDFSDLLEIINQYRGIRPGHAAEDMERIRHLEQEMDLEYTSREVLELLSGISEGAMRTTEIVRGLRIFSRLDEAEFNKSNVMEGLESTLILLNSAMQNDVTVERDYADLPMIDCYPGKLNQVFMNIIGNGVYAVLKRPDKRIPGKLIIRAANAGDYIKISFIDNGCGMSKKTLENMFEPFYTTKPVGEGTGMGMAISYGIIVNEHKGKLYAESEPGVGSSVHIEIPKNLSDKPVKGVIDL